MQSPIEFGEREWHRHCEKYYKKIVGSGQDRDLLEEKRQKEREKEGKKKRKKEVEIGSLLKSLGTFPHEGYKDENNRNVKRNSLANFSLAQVSLLISSITLTILHMQCNRQPSSQSPLPYIWQLYPI